MALKEEDDLRQAQGTPDAARAAAALEKTVRPALPRHVSREALLARSNPAETVILTCGNPLGMADIKHIAETNHIRYEKEDW
jgi:hypothetical protein